MEKINKESINRNFFLFGVIHSVTNILAEAYFNTWKQIEH